MTGKFAQGAGGLLAADASYSTPAGFATGSRILTLDGEMPVEFLSPGDRIITRDCGMAVLAGVSAVEAELQMVSIMAGTLGHTNPDEDTLIPAGQMVLLRDWRAQALFGRPQALAPAHALVDGEFIRLAGKQKLRLVLLEFDAPHVLYIDGMELACTPPGAARKAA